MSLLPIAYPNRAAQRDQWILAQRPPRNAVDPETPYAFHVEDERTSTGAIVPVTTIFLTNRECPWRCVMCDLWRNTLAEPTPPGAIPAQIEHALSNVILSAAKDPAVPSVILSAAKDPAVPRVILSAAKDPAVPPAPRHVKLYNAGSFFDPRAIPPEDHLAIAEAVRQFNRVVVECHPALINDAVLRFRDLLSGQLEIAMGLETAHPEVLEKLNKRLTLDQFKAAADFLHRNSIDLRVFILVQPPFMQPEESLHWAERSLDFAFDCEATAATLIPTRGGNGAMESLARAGDFTPPTLATFEAAVAYGLTVQRGRARTMCVSSDLWDLPRTIDCPACSQARVERLRAMNLSQTLLPAIPCEICGGNS